MTTSNDTFREMPRYALPDPLPERCARCSSHAKREVDGNHECGVRPADYGSCDHFFEHLPNGTRNADGKFLPNSTCQRKYNEAMRNVAQYSLGRLIKLGCYIDEGTDEPVEGSHIYGSFWWPIVRKAVLERDRHVCQICGSDGLSDIPSGRLSAIEVHHIKNRQYGGSDNPLNLVSLCDGCHDIIHTAGFGTIDSARKEYIRRKKKREAQRNLDTFTCGGI